MSDVFIYEFLFRGGDTTKLDDDTWHVILARPVVMLDGTTKLEIGNPMPPSEAVKLGFPLSKILSSLNQRAVDALVDAKARTLAAEALAETHKTALANALRVHSVETAPLATKTSFASRLTGGLIK